MSACCDATSDRLDLIGAIFSDLKKETEQYNTKTLDGVTRCPEMRKPFDVFAEGLLVASSRVARI